MKRTRNWLLLLAVMMLLLSPLACGDDDDDNDDNDDNDDTDDDNDDDADDDTLDDDTLDDDTLVDDDTLDDDTLDDDTGDDDTSTVCCASITRQPYLQHVTQTSIRIMWFSRNEGDTKVEWGPTEDLGQEVYINERTHHHLAEITGLEPETTYYYRAVTCDNPSAVSTFTTAPLVDTPFSYAVYGDNRTFPEDHRAVAEQMLVAAPDIILNVGDIITHGWTFSQFDTEFFEPLVDLIDHTPIYISIGNHEGEAPYYYRSFSYPGSNSKFSFTYGNTFFIAFNSNRPHFPGSPQFIWLQEQLASDEALDAEFIIVFCHHPAYSEGWEGYEGNVEMRDTLIPLFEANGVDVFFAGHTHDYERGHLNGMTHYITGGGGGALDTQARDFEHIVFYRSAYHFINVTVAGSTMTLDAIDIDGELFDTYTIVH
ncbi:MAG TPA: metallophosphoesterase family protein [bacterium]|nr:metallophosphoesterase family protein [bacterium]